MVIQHDFDAQSKIDVFYGNTINIFHGSQNIVVILAHGCKFLSAKYAQFP